MNRLGQHRTSILWFQGTFSPKPREDLQRLSLPGCQEGGNALAVCSWSALWLLREEEESLEALPGRDTPQQGLGSGCRPEQQFPISLHATIVLWLPKGYSVPTLYSQLEMSPTFWGRALWGKWLRMCQGGQCSQGKPPDQVQQGLDQAGELPYPSTGAGLWQSSMVSGNFPRDFRYRLIKEGKDSVSLDLRW